MSTNDFDRDFAVLDELEIEESPPELPYDPLLREVLASIGSDSDSQEEEDPAIAEEDPEPVRCPRCQSIALTREECFARCADCAIWIVHAGIQGVPECYVLPWSEFSRIPQRF